MKQISARFIYRTEEYPNGFSLVGKMGNLDAKVWLSVDVDKHINVEILIDNPDGSSFTVSTPLDWEIPIRHTPD